MTGRPLLTAMRGAVSYLMMRPPNNFIYLCLSLLPTDL